LWMARVDDRFVHVDTSLDENTYRDRAAVFGDLEGDGDTDVIVAERNGAVRVLRNDTQASRPLVIQLKGQSMGAKIKITLDDGTVVSRWKHSGGGFQSSVLTDPVFSFPEGRFPVQMEITWGNGDRQLSVDVPRSGVFTVFQPKSSNLF